MRIRDRLGKDDHDRIAADVRPAPGEHHARPLSHELPHGEGFLGNAEISRRVSARHATIGQHAHPNLLDCSIAVGQLGKLQRFKISSR